MDLMKIVADAHQGIEFGTVNIFIKKHEGEISTIDAQKVTTHKVNNNTEALSLVIQMQKAMNTTRQSGNLTFTITFNDGEAKKVQVQDFKHNTSKQWG